MTATDRVVKFVPITDDRGEQRRIHAAKVDAHGQAIKAVYEMLLNIPDGTPIRDIRFKILTIHYGDSA